jgi:hypothetical protein
LRKRIAEYLEKCNEEVEKMERKEKPKKTEKTKEK